MTLKTSDLFPIRQSSGGAGTVDTTAPKVVLLDNPSVKVSNGQLRIDVRTLILDESTYISQVLPSNQKPKVSIVSLPSATILASETLKVQLRFEELSVSSPPVASVVQYQTNATWTPGDEPIKVRLRIEG